MASVYCPEMNCFCSSGVYKQPNMRLFSFNEHDEWTLWRSNSDYFYPEMIPEPDYSDSGDDAEDEDEEYISFGRNSIPVTERLRDLTEVYVSNADVKIKPASPRMSSKQANSSRKQQPKSLTSEITRRQPGKLSPRSPRRTASKSPAKDSKLPSSAIKMVKPQENTKKTPVKTKFPPKVIAAVSSTSKKTKSPERSKRTPTRPKSPAKASGEKSAAARSKSPKSMKEVPTRKKLPTGQTAVSENEKVSKLTPKSETGEKTNLPSSKIKPTSKEMTATKHPAVTNKREAGDGQKTKTDTSPLSSPISDESKSSMSSAISTEHSSDDELIKPKKPYQFSTEKQKLHKELKFSQRYGKLVSSKTELQMALERFTENKERKELEIGEKTSLEKILEVQARKLKMQEETDKTPSWMDHLQKPPANVQNRKTDEFYRVHARVVNSNVLTHCFLTDDDHYECSSSQTLTHTESGSDS